MGLAFAAAAVIQPTLPNTTYSFLLEPFTTTLDTPSAEASRLDLETSAPHPSLSASRQPHHTANMSAQNSAGIQTLLEAEKDASKIVQKAREYRTKRVREARDEAKKEIEAYKAKKEEEYKKFEAEHSQGNKKAEEDANKEAEDKIKEIEASGKKTQDTVIKDLLAAVFDVQAEPPTASA